MLGKGELACDVNCSGMPNVVVCGTDAATGPCRANHESPLESSEAGNWASNGPRVREGLCVIGLLA